MKHEDDVRHKSEEVDDAVLADVVKALHRRVKLDHEHDIPYIAGYSQNGKTIYIDRHLPGTLVWKGQAHHVSPFLLTHEKIEKALLDEIGLHYLHAHQIALRAECDAVRGAGISWRAYQSFMKKHEKQISDERILKVPHDLDLTPYRDERDFAILNRLVREKR